MIVELLIFVVFAIYLKRLFYFAKWDYFPGPKAWSSLPWVGHSYLLGKDPLAALPKFQKKYGDIFRLDIGGIPTVFICDYDVALNAFRKEVRKFHNCPASQRLI